MSFVPPQPGLSGIKLAAIPCAAFDTESTGLNIARDRLIEIGAVRLDKGRIDETGGFSMLVDPGMPIPPSSTAIHGITDADVTGAPDFASAVADFAEWTGPSVLIGHSIEFDLALLKAEHDRLGLVWRPPRTLDVRVLAQALRPDLPDPSLETLTDWLDIPVEGRHRALADAVTAARAFLALLPRLRERRVETLAEAERMCAAIGGSSLPWAQRARTAPPRTEYVGIDSFPYRHRVGAVMTPAVSVEPGLPLSKALARMSETRVSALFVAAKGEEKDGIFTERDVLKVIHEKGAAALSLPIGKVCSRPLGTVGQDEFLYRALTAMASQGIRHLGVLDGNGTLVGALSARGLLRQRAADVVSLGQVIEDATDPAELGRIWSGLTTVARSLVEERTDAREVASVISRELRALTRRACQIAEAELTQSAQPPPPEAWAMLVLGSGGRGESLLAMDQDNAIVFRENAHGRSADQWCEQVGRRAADILDAAGVRYCQGGVMAFNRGWRHDLDGWRKTVATWLSRTSPEDILNADIFFDAAPVHGDAALADRLLKDAALAAQQTVPFLQLMARRAAERRAPLGMFGRFKLERGRIDLKKGGIMPLFSAARVVALRRGIAVRSTVERLRAAAEAGDAPQSTVNDLIAAHEILLAAVLRQQLGDLERGIPLSNRIEPGALDGFRRQELKWALSRVSAVTDIMGVPPSV